MADELLAAAAEALETAAAAIRASLDARGRVASVKKRWRVTARRPRGKEGRYWQLRFFPPAGEGRPGKPGTPYQRTAKPATTEEAAWALARAKEAELNCDCLPFDELARRYVEFRSHDRETRPLTIVQIDQATRRFVDYLDGREVSKKAILGIQDAMRAELAPSTINTYVGTAALTWAWGLERELVNRPWPGHRKLRRQPTDKRPCTNTETSAILAGLLEHAGGYYYGFFVLVADLGSRLTETLALREQDVDRQACLVTFRKTKTVSRTVCVSPEALSVVPVRAHGADLLFPKRRGGLLGRSHAYKVWTTVAKKVGLGDEPISPHSLRRSWITDSLSNGVPLTQSMRHTGHRSPQVHMDYQRNAPDQRMREAAKLVSLSRPLLPHTHTSALALSGGASNTVTHKEVTQGSMSDCHEATADWRAQAQIPSQLPPVALDHDRLWALLHRMARTRQEWEALRALAIDPQLQRRVLISPS